VILEKQQPSGIGHESISGPLLVMFHQTVETKVGEKMYYVSPEVFSSYKTKCPCMPPPNMLVLQMLDCSTKLLLWSQLFPDVLLADGRQ